MFTGIGILLLIISIVLWAGSRINDNMEPGDRRFPKINKKATYVTSGLSVFAFFLAFTLMYANAGYQYFVVTPFGTKYAIMDEGFKFVMPGSKISEWSKYIDIKVVNTDDDEEDDLDEIEGVMDPIPIRFIDQVTANVYVSTRFELPTVAEDFIDLAIKFRTQSNLVNNTLISTVKEQTVNTGYMFAAQDYISGEAQQFRTTLDEQLKNGTYAVNKIEIKDTVYNNIQEETDDREIKEIQTKYLVEKEISPNGRPKIIEHELTKNNISAVQVIVDFVRLEDTFKKRLEKQRDESAKRQLEQQKIETAKAAQSRIIAEGERDKAAERVEQEKEQVKALIAIETQLKQEETKRKLAEIALKTERLNSQKKKVEAEAESYKNRQLVNAGLTPQQKMERDIKIADMISKNLAGPNGVTFPQIYQVGGGANKEGDALNQMMQLMLGQQMLQTQKQNSGNGSK